MKIPEQPRQFELWINGKLTQPESGSYITRISPAHDVPVTLVPEGSKGDVDKAVASAKQSFEAGTWANLSGAERAEVLQAVAAKLVEFSSELALYETLESGKPLTQSGFEVQWAAGLWKHAAALCRHLYGESCNTLGQGTVSMTLREPIGVVGLITPWNFPLLIASQKAPYALAAGCSMVIKPSELTSATTLLLAEILKDCGLSDGVFNVVTGYGDPVGQTLCEHEDVEMISFTGSTKVGKAISSTAACNLKKVCLELGGKNPMALNEIMLLLLLRRFWQAMRICHCPYFGVYRRAYADSFAPA